MLYPLPTKDSPITQTTVDNPARHPIKYIKTPVIDPPVTPTQTDRTQKQNEPARANKALNT
jgi:hypothetical protein